MPLDIDPYKVLGLNCNASMIDIKKNFRVLSMKYHPDKNLEQDTTHLFQQACNAYELLKTTDLKKIYDEQIIKDTLDIPIIDHTLSIFNIPVILYELSITLEQTYLGDTIPIEIDKYILNNNIKTYKHETVYVNVSKGLDNNDVIIINNRGNHHNEHVGNIKVVITVLSHDIYERRGMDIYMKHIMTLKESLCGTIFEVNHINNNIYKFKTNKVVYPGKQFIINQLGMVRNMHIGNLIIEIIIKFPESISPEINKQLQTIL
jgi:DnaJ-class molecular chaperone